MPAPVTGWPTTRPVVSATVIVEELRVVTAPVSATAGAEVKLPPKLRAATVAPL